MLFHEYFKTKRREVEPVRTVFCSKYNLDTGNISKLESGKMRPPLHEEKLEVYATFIGIKKYSEEWFVFLDLACASNGKIPTDILDDNLKELLPTVYKYLRYNELTSEQIQKIKDLYETGIL